MGATDGINTMARITFPIKVINVGQCRGIIAEEAETVNVNDIQDAGHKWPKHVVWYKQYKFFQFIEELCWIL
jgi:hypothetical protein